MEPLLRAFLLRLFRLFPPFCYATSYCILSALNCYNERLCWISLTFVDDWFPVFYYVFNAFTSETVSANKNLGANVKSDLTGGSLLPISVLKPVAIWLLAGWMPTSVYGSTSGRSTERKQKSAAKDEGSASTIHVTASSAPISFCCRHNSLLPDSNIYCYIYIYICIFVFYRRR